MCGVSDGYPGRVAPSADLRQPVREGLTGLLLEQGYVVPEVLDQLVPLRRGQARPVVVAAPVQPRQQWLGGAAPDVGRKGCTNPCSGAEQPTVLTRPPTVGHVRPGVAFGDAAYMPLG